MTYVPFKKRVSRSPAATIATVATVLAPADQTVANVATVAGAQRENAISSGPPSAASVATVASVAAVPRESAISATEVLVMFERARERLLAMVEERAREIVRSELHNDQRLAPAQPDMTRCLICGKEDGLVPVLSAVPGRHHSLHAGECHAEHMRRQEAKVTACMAAAGLTPPPQETGAADHEP